MQIKEFLIHTVQINGFQREPIAETHETSPNEAPEKCDALRYLCPTDLSFQKYCYRGKCYLRCGTLSENLPYLSGIIPFSANVKWQYGSGFLGSLN